MATSKPRPAALQNPVRSAHPNVVESDDWRNRGTSSDMATPLWFTSKHDIGAYTRFGFGWGPIEVIRDERRENGVRVVKVRINGETINTIEVDDRGSIVRTHTEDSADVMTSAPKTGCAADVMTDKLRGLVEVFKTDLTDKRREKKYVTRAMIDAIDELTDIVDQL